MKTAFLIAQVLGGLALFIYGMNVMSDGLQRAAGNKLRDLLYHLTRNRFAGFSVGTVVSFLVHSSATTVMVVGFINAGLMTLEQSVPVMLGANVGTTFSMQIISFKLDEYAFFAVAAGLMLQLLSGKRLMMRHIGTVLFGFGLLFLGMKTMSMGVAPLKGEALQAFLRQTEATTLLGVLTGLAISTAITGVIQSSGAMVGILFALSTAGVFTNLQQVFPLLLGAHVGTCATALLGSIGTNIQARRSAISHLLFNAIGALIAIAMLPFYLWLIPKTADDLVRQIANAHTIVQFINAAIFLPFAFPYARLIARITPHKGKEPERSHLEERYLDTPEMAIVAALRESQRMSRMTLHQLTLAMKGLVDQTDAPFAEVNKTEEAVNTLKRSIRAYLIQLAGHKLSKRQSVLVQHILSSVTDLERIGDHATVLTELTNEKVQRKVWFDDDSMASLVELFSKAKHVLDLTCKSLDPQMPEEERRQLAQDILEARAAYAAFSKEIRQKNLELVRTHKEDALTGLFFSRYSACFDKVVGHSRSIAKAEMKPVFFVKDSKLLRRAELVARPPLPKNGGLQVDKRIFDEE
jgi:phosphate:Na+ symporter